MALLWLSLCPRLHCTGRHADCLGSPGSCCSKVTGLPNEQYCIYDWQKQTTVECQCHPTKEEASFMPGDGAEAVQPSSYNRGFWNMVTWTCRFTLPLTNCVDLGKKVSNALSNLQLLIHKRRIIPISWELFWVFNGVSQVNA